MERVPDFADSHQSGTMPNDILALAEPKARDPHDLAGMDTKGNDGSADGHGAARRLRIFVEPDNLAESIPAAVAALAARDHELFQREGGLVALVKEPNGELRIGPVKAKAMPERLARVTVFVRRGRDGEPVVCAPPKAVWEGVFARETWDGIRPLRGIVTAPVLRPDGTVMSRAGYDLATGLYFHRRAAFPSVPDAPSLEDAQRAARELAAPFVDFPFFDDVHRSAFLAVILTCLARVAIAGPSPGIVLEANVRGSGKSLLAACIGYIVTGIWPAGATFPEGETERAKTILSELREGRPLLLFDDVSGPIGGSQLNKLLTATQVSGRILAASRIATLPVSCVVVFTANNAVVTGDTLRRVLPIRLVSVHERPEDRQGFAIPDLRAHVATHRPRLVVAGLTVLRAWFAAGKPDMALSPWGSFEAWSQVIRSALVWAGQPDPAGARVDCRDDEAVDLENIAAVHKAMADLGRSLGRPVTAKDAAGAATRNDHCLADALAALPGRHVEHWDANSVGYRLRKVKDRPVRGLRLVMSGRGGGVRAWEVEELPTDDRGRGGAGGHGC
ncbi:MAG: hypothetical protein ACOYOB_16985 [Myxococcota bacterium]